jgi:phage shock protein PspC (stress-responsive transcriptional regulator)
MPNSIADNLLLPVDQLKRLSGPGSLGMAEAFDKGHDIVRHGLVVFGIFGLEFRGSIAFQRSQAASPPLQQQKRPPKWAVLVMMIWIISF